MNDDNFLADMFAAETQIACSDCGLTMKQSEQLYNLPTVISFLHLIHHESKKPDNGAKIRYIVEQAMFLLREPMTLTNEV